MIENFPATSALVLVYDSLSGTDPIDAISVSGSPLTFEYALAANSALTFWAGSSAPVIPTLGREGIAGLLFGILASPLLLLWRKRGCG